MNRGSLILLGVALSLPLLLLLSFRGADGIVQLYEPTGYIEEVNRLIEENKLVYDCATESIAPRNLSPGEAYFLDNSYLKGDLARWRAGDRRPFEVQHEEYRSRPCEGRLLRVNPSTHRQRLPEYEPTSWQGRLFVRRSQDSVFLSADRSLEISRPSWLRLPFEAEAYEDVWLDRESDVRSERMALKLFEQGRMFASLQHVGNDVAVEIFATRPRVELNGCFIDQGRRIRLDDGDRVRFVERPTIDVPYRVEAGESAQLISSVNVVNGNLRRRTVGSRLAMGSDVARAINEVVHQARGESGRDDFDVHLTFDTFLEDLLDDELSAFSRERYGRRPLRAGVTLLEAESGRVLAMASYPRPGDAEELALKRESHLSLLTRNNNLLQHAVGSAAKPFLAAAALATQPQLGTLVLPCVGLEDPPTSFLGFDFGEYNLPPDCVGVRPRPIDFERFLEVSSNRYMLALGLLATAEWTGARPRLDEELPALPARDVFRVAGEDFRHRPDLDVVMDESNPGATELADLSKERFFQKFRDLFGHRVHHEAGLGALDTYSWLPVLEAAGASDRASRIFSSVAPERVDLRANLIQQLRQDFYTVMLGNGNNRWNNLLLAESLARLVTGRTIRASMLERVEAPGAIEATPEVLWDLEATLDDQAPLELSQSDRRRVLSGMRAVVLGDDGTAKDLQEILADLNTRAPPGVRYAALGKTGTPSLDARTVAAGPTEPGPEAVKRYSGREQVNSAALVLAIQRFEGDSTQTLSMAFYIESQGGSEQTTALAARVLAPLVEAYWPEDWLLAP